MGDSIITIVAIFIVAILMLIYPLLAIAQNNENVTQLAVQTVLSEFVNDVTTRGVIRQTDVDRLQQNLDATGNTFDVEFEIALLDENPGKKTVIVHTDAIGENLRFSIFTTTIEEALARDGFYLLSMGDTVQVTVRNTNRTIAQLLRDFFYSAVGRSEYQIGASFSGMVVNSGRAPATN
ncbi:MAG: hypothetical protein FWC79_05895 [Oscillospiraceae bacterium]|nr:hypothetical protein [Oscillospiraceae bacterium]